MKITDIKTYLVNANVPDSRGWRARNWLFIKVFTDEGIYGVGEGSGWPRVVETAVKDLTPLLIGENPFEIEKLWQKMFIAMMGHGMTGIVGGGALTAIDMALWDIKGKALGVPVYELLGGKIRDSVRLYAHAQDGRTRSRTRRPRVHGHQDRRCGSRPSPASRPSVEEVGPEIDIMVDIHGPPWLTTKDAIAMGKALEEYEPALLRRPDRTGEH